MDARALRAAAAAAFLSLILGACGGGGGGGGGGGSSGGGSSGAGSSSGGASSSGSSGAGSSSSSSSSGGGNSSGSSSSGGGSSGSSGSSSGSALNQGLPGELYFDDPVDFVQLDLPSGVVTAIRPKGSGSNASYDATPSSDATQFALVQFNPLSGSTSTSEVDAIGDDGRTVVRLEKDQSLDNPAKLSPDKSHIIVSWNDVSQGESCCIATVFDTKGNAVQRYAGYTNWDWLPNGGLLLVKGDSIYSVGPTLGTPQLLKQFAGDTPDYLAVSPDGSRVAFDLGNASLSKNHIYVMNIDGSGVQQLTTSALNEDGASWSPDGKYLALRYAIAYSAISGGIAGVACPTVYIVPSSASQVQIDASNPAPAFAAQQLNGGTPAKVCAFTVPNWRAAPAALPSAGGTASQGSGANAGLSGKMVFQSGGTVESLSLSSGSVSTVPVNGSASYPFVSPDGSLLALVQSATGAANTVVTLQKLDGTAQGGFSSAQGFLGAPKLAPGNQSLAIYYLGSSSSNAGKPIVGTYSVSGTAGPAFLSASEYSWLPDGRLALAGLNLLAQSTDATLAKLQAVATLSDQITGLAASPDGSTLAFALAGHVWTIHDDGSALKQLTVSGAEEAQPAWSPDGKYVAVQYAGTCPTLVVVPADGQRVFIGNAAVSSTALTVSGNGKAGVCANSDVSWR